jgi:hypothetical protein
MRRHRQIKLAEGLPRDTLKTVLTLLEAIGDLQQPKR